MSRSTFNIFAIMATLFSSLAVAAPAAGPTEQPLTAPASDPHVLGWMQGFPPPPDKIDHATLIGFLQLSQVALVGMPPLASPVMIRPVLYCLAMATSGIQA